MRKQKLTFFPESTLGSVATDTEGGVFSVVGVVVFCFLGCIFWENKWIFYSDIVHFHCAFSVERVRWFLLFIFLCSFKMIKLEGTRNGEKNNNLVLVIIGSCELKLAITRRMRHVDSCP